MKRQPRKIKRRRKPLHTTLGEILVGFFGIMLVQLYLIAGIHFFTNKHAQTAPTPSGTVAGAGEQFPDTYVDHRDYRCEGACATRNLITEESSFEVGFQDSFDALNVFRRMFYAKYNPGSGDILSADPAHGYIPPVITTERYKYGTHSLKIANPRQDSVYTNLNWIRVPTTGIYVFSVWMKAENLGTNTNIFTAFEIYDKHHNGVVNGSGDQRIWPFQGWIRKYVTTNVLQAGEFYSPLIKMGSYNGPDEYAQGTLYIDAVQFELAADQGNPQPSEYVRQTTTQELFAYSSPEASGASLRRGNVYYADDHDAIYGHIQIQEDAPLEAGAHLKWGLFDSYGDSNDPTTSLADGTIAVSHSLANFQTAHLNLSDILASVPAEKLHGLESKLTGVFKLTIELWNSDETVMSDKEFLITTILTKSPYRDEVLPNSFFGNHVGLHFTSTNHLHGIETTVPNDELLSLGQNIGIKYTRQFGLLDQGNTEDEPYFDDYVNGVLAHNMEILPVVPQRTNNLDADQPWQDWLSGVVQHYGSAINQYEILNEPLPPQIPYTRYYTYLWRGRQAVKENNPNAVVMGPSSNNDYLADLIPYDDGVHGAGYWMFDAIAQHFYPEYQSNGMRIPPEQADGVGIDGMISAWNTILDTFTPNGSAKPRWATEYATNNSRLADDIPIVFGDIWGVSADLRPAMSGSLAVSKYIAGNFVREHLYLLSDNLLHGFYFGLNATTIQDGGGMSLFDYDGSGSVMSQAFATMTSMLEQATYVRRVEADLKTNGVLASESRAFVFRAPDPTVPGATRPIAVVFNYNQNDTGAILSSIQLPTDQVKVYDIEGNQIHIDAGSTFSVPIDGAPRYVVGEDSMSTADFVAALDDARPAAPFRPTVTVPGDDIKIAWTRTADYDLASYKVYRRPAGGGDETLVATVNRTADFWQQYLDHAPTGLWEYRVAAVEQGTNAESFSFYSPAISRNLAPTILPIDNKVIHEADPLQFTVTADDPDPSDTLVLTAEHLPLGAQFTDNHNRTGTFTWQPNTNQAGPYPGIRFTVSDGEAQAYQDITITVLDGVSNCVPNWGCTGWSACTNNMRTRTCTDANRCGSDVGKPNTVETCDSTPPNPIDDLNAE